MASVSSLATSFGRTESLSSEHLFKDETGERDLGCEYLKGMFKELAVFLFKIHTMPSASVFACLFQYAHWQHYKFVNKSQQKLY